MVGGQFNENSREQILGQDQRLRFSLSRPRRSVINGLRKHIESFSFASIQRVVCLASLSLCLPSLDAVGQFEQGGNTSDSLRREQYFVLRAENTSLQKFLLGKPQAEEEFVVHLLIDGQAVLDDERPVRKAVDWERLRQDLQNVHGGAVIQNLPKATPRSVSIRTYFSARRDHEDQFLNWALEGFARQSARFDFVRLTSTYSHGGSQLMEKVDTLIADGLRPFDEDANEGPRENDYVKVFPVRTFLSRFLTDNADCVVVIKPRFSDEFTGGLPRAIRTSMSVLIRQLQLENQHKLMFSFAYSQPQGEEAKNWFVEKGGRELQRFLGFDRSSIVIGYQ